MKNEGVAWIADRGWLRATADGGSDTTTGAKKIIEQYVSRECLVRERGKKGCVEAIKIF